MNAVAVVTGANRGIGLEIVRQLAEREVTVVLTARDETSGKAAVNRLGARAGGVRFHPLDVTDDGSAHRLAEYVATEFGVCDILINNAGIIADGDSSILSVAPRAVETTLATNTVGPLRITQALLPSLSRSTRDARIVNVSSGAGELKDFDGSWAPAYSLSKAALNLVTRMLAVAGAEKRIVVNSMCPGWVRTDMGGAGAPRDVTAGADTAVWLALDAPGSVTGKFFRDRQEIAR
jgi:NAD(P)-dependent dehydrogenase (short-subunit alcohol dehydrogenase family)